MSKKFSRSVLAIAVTGVIGVGCIAAFWSIAKPQSSGLMTAAAAGGNSEASQELNSQGQASPGTIGRSLTSLKGEYPLTKESAEFKESSVCVNASRSLDLMRTSLSNCSELLAESHSEPGDAFAASCLERKTKYEPAIAEAENDLKACGSSESIERNFYERTKLAAEKGDIDAQICYLGARFVLDETISDADITLYSQVAHQYLDAGIKRGDWRVVEVVYRATPAMLRDFPLLSQLSIGQLDRYKMNQLLLLGAGEQSYRTLLEVGTEREARGLSATEKATATSWAQSTFNSYFRTSDKLSQVPRTCMSLWSDDPYRSGAEL